MHIVNIYLELHCGQLSMILRLILSLVPTTIYKKLVLDSRPEIIRKSIEGRLTKLKTDYLDL